MLCICAYRHAPLEYKYKHNAASIQPPPQAGLLLAETEFHLQVESDIAPYKGLLMGLFFMTVGMEISVGLFFAKWKSVLAGISMLILGKTAVVAAVGGLFGLSITQVGHWWCDDACTGASIQHLHNVVCGCMCAFLCDTPRACCVCHNIRTRTVCHPHPLTSCPNIHAPQSIRAGLLLAPGGEFAFVLLGEAMGCGLMSNAAVREIFLVVALSMALTPYLAEFGQKIGRMFEKNDVKVCI